MSKPAKVRSENVTTPLLAFRVRVPESVPEPADTVTAADDVVTVLPFTSAIRTTG